MPSDVLITPASSKIDFTDGNNSTKRLNISGTAFNFNSNLNVLSSTSLSSAFKAEGVNGTLFEVTDDLSNSLMSVNTIGGLPVFEVFANNSIIGGQYGANDFVISGNKIGLGLSNPVNKLSVSGAVSIGASYNVAAPSNGLIVQGSVGIGITNPTAKLDVAGGGLSVSGWSNNNSGSTGGVEIGWDGTQGIFQVYDRVNANYEPILINGSAIQFFISGGLKWTLTTAGVLQSNNAQTIRTSTGNLTLATNAGDGHILLSPHGNGNVGIGVASPRVLLDLAKANNVGQVLLLGEVGANIRVGFGLAPSNAGMRIFSLNHITDGLIEFGGISSTDGSTWTRNHRLGLAGANSFFNEQGGNVGIGATNPIGKLQLGANYADDGYGGYDIYVKSTTVGTLSSYDPRVQNTSTFSLLITDSSSTTTGPDKIGLVLHNNNATAGAFSPMLLFTKKESGSTPYKATMAGIYARSPLGTGNTDSWIDGELIFATAGAASEGIKQRMVIDKEGNVGIGATSPAAKLHVYNGSSHFEATSNGNAAIVAGLYALQIGPLHDRDSTAGRYYGGIAFNHLLNFGGATTYNGAPQAWIGTRLQDTTGSERDYLVFATKPGTGVSGTGNDIPIERMCIDRDGNVGIGAISPASKLSIAGSSATNFKSLILRNGDGTVGSTVSIDLETSAGTIGDEAAMAARISGIRLGSGTTGGLIFSTTNSGTLGERVRIINNGNVGIGTTSPVQKLELHSAVGDPYTSGVNQDGIMRFSNTTDNAVFDIGMRGGGAGAWLQSTDKTNLGVNYPLLLNPNGGNVSIGALTASNKLHVNGSVSVGSNYNTAATTNGLIVEGNVGIGITGPTAKLDVTGSNTNGYSLLLRSGDNYNGTDSVQIAFGFANQTNYRHSIRTRHNPLAPIGGVVGNNIDFYVWKRGTDAAADLGSQFVMTMQGDGNVGIGTISPTQILDVRGNIKLGGDNSGNYIYYVTDVERTIVRTTRSDVTQEGLLRSDGWGNFTFNKSIAVGYSLGSGPLTGNIYASGSIGIGTTIPTAKLDVLGVRLGRDFSIANRATVRLDANGAGFPSDILFGHTAAANQDSWNGVYWSLSSRATANSNRFYFYRGTGNPAPNNSEAVIMSFDPNLNVGVGFEAPANRLSIAGSVSIGSGYNTAAPTNGLIVEGSVAIGATTASDKLTVANGNISLTNSYKLYNGSAADSAGLFFSSNQVNISGFSGIIFRSSTTNIPGQTERMRITNNGNIGIGITVPSAALHVNSTTSGATLLRADGTNGTLFSVVDDLSDSLMSVNNSAGLPVLEVFADDRVVAGQYGANDFILINNKLGLGTNSPAYKLDVRGSTVNARVGLMEFGAWPLDTTYIYLQNNSLSLIGANYGFLQSPAGETFVNAASGQVLHFRTGNTERWAITSGGILQSDGAQTIRTSTNALTLATNGGNGHIILSPNGTGNVGVANTSPNAKLEVSGSLIAGGVDNGSIIFYRNTNPATIGNTDAVLYVSDRSNSDWGIIVDKTGWDYALRLNVANSSTNAFGIYDGSTYNALLYGNGGGYFLGNISIGTSSTPSARLRLTSSNNSRVLWFTGATTGYTYGQIDNSGGSYYIGMSDNVGQFWGSTPYAGYHATLGTSANIPLTFATNNLIRVLIDNNGNVGIGTTSPAALLQIGTGTPTAATGGIQFGGDTGARIYRVGASTIQVSNNLTVGGTITGNLAGNVTGNVSGSSGSCTGNAATASLATTSDRLTTRDNRTISPSSDDAFRLRYGFTSWANNNTSPYADYLHLRSYSDASGGNDNLVMFRKDAIGMRIYQAGFGTSVAYSSFKDVAFTDQSFFIGTTSVAINRASAALTLSGVNISGTAASETFGTVTGRGASTATQISVGTTAGGSMYTGIKSGAGYSDSVSGATFKSITDHPTGGSFAFAAYYNGAPGTGTNSFYVGADGSGYFKSTLTTSVIKADAGANYPHSFTNTDAGNTHWVNRSDRLLTSNGTGWQTDGRDPIMALVTSGNSNSLNIANSIGLTLHNESQTNNTFSPAITFSNRSNSGSYNTTYAAIIGRKTGQGPDSNWSAGELHFYTMPVGAYVNNIPSLIINSAGNVGVGIIAPAAKLNVLSSTSLSSVFKTEGVNGTLFEVTDDLSNSLMSVNTIGGLPVFEVFANNSIIAGQYGQNDFVISGNKIGIGTASPVYKLNVYDNSSGNIDEIFIGTIGNDQIAGGRTGGSFGISTKSTSNGNLILTASSAMYLRAGGNTRVFIKNDGNVGVGTETPGDKLDVVGAVRTDKLRSNGVVYLGITGTKSANASAFNMFDINNTGGNQTIEIVLSHHHSGGGQHGSFRRTILALNGYTDYIILEDTSTNFGGGLGFTITRTSATTIRIGWAGATAFSSGYTFIGWIKGNGDYTITNVGMDALDGA